MKQGMFQFSGETCPSSKLLGKKPREVQALSTAHSVAFSQH